MDNSEPAFGKAIGHNINGEAMSATIDLTVAALATADESNQSRIPRWLTVHLPLCVFSAVLLAVVALGITACAPTWAQNVPHSSFHIDSDHDGISDHVEQTLLEQFRPTFMIGRQDCSAIPAEFRPGIAIPTVESENGTIYGQVFPARTSTDDQPVAEIHYYHLWKRDCGPHGHALDTEHVAVLVRASSSHLGSATWQAVYWYAAAHENTVCDVSQITRASTLHAEDHGAKVWISPGKHASYLNEALCQRGCGADRCKEMVALPQGKVINLGELNHPMNGSVFVRSSAWPLAAKMDSTNFPAAPIAHLDALPEDDIAWFNPGRHPAQQIIAISGGTEQKIAHGGEDTTSAIAGAGDSTDVAMTLANGSTQNAMAKSYRHTKHALGKSVRRVGEALHVTPKGDKN